MPIGAVVSLADYNSLTVAQQAGLNDPYHISMQECTFNTAFASCMRVYPPQPVAMIYAKQKEFKRCEALWHAIKESNAPVGHFMSSYTTGEPADYWPLQAADIWAYELGHHFEYIIPNGKPKRWAFKEFFQLCVANCAGHRFFTMLDKEEMLVRLGESTDEN
jgi:hypothetical protein